MKWIATALPLALAAACGGSPGAAREEAPDMDRAMRLYADSCAVCHGDQGRGDGPAAYLLNPKPRDFTKGQFRIVTTDNGVPSDEDLLGVIRNGMPGSAMPAWDRHPESDQRLLVRAVKRLWHDGLLARYLDDGIERSDAERYVAEETTPGAPLDASGAPDPTPALVARGRIVYSQACMSCHGADGRGDASRVLLDSDGYPAPARDFTRGLFKGGSEPRQIFARLRSGMRGTAMPTFGADMLSDDEAWAVVHYVRTLFPEGAQERQRQTAQTIFVKRVAKAPADDAAWWRDATAARIALTPLWWRDRRVEGVLVQAAHDGEHLFLRLCWEDATKDDGILRPQDFHDGAAVQTFAGESPPSFAMGAKGGAVRIWSWKASWQEDLAGFRDLEAVYPYYASPHEGFPGHATARDAKNPVASERKSAVEIVDGAGLGTITTSPEQGAVQGEGSWDRGVWTLVLKAKRTEAECRGLHVAFAVWDGSEGDRNGQKSVSVWHRLELE